MSSKLTDEQVRRAARHSMAQHVRVSLVNASALRVELLPLLAPRVCSRNTSARAMAERARARGGSTRGAETTPRKNSASRTTARVGAVHTARVMKLASRSLASSRRSNR